MRCAIFIPQQLTQEIVNLSKRSGWLWLFEMTPELPSTQPLSLAPLLSPMARVRALAPPPWAKALNVSGPQGLYQILSYGFSADSMRQSLQGSPHTPDTYEHGPRIDVRC